MRNTQNHVVRRNIGNMHFKNLKGFKKSTSHDKFPPKFEKKIESWMKNKLEVHVLPLYLGRKELEEYLLDKNSTRYNKKSKRKPKETKYERFGKVIKDIKFEL